MKKSMLSVALTASVLMLSATAVQADYYQYNDELRKSGQTVEEAKKEQVESYREAMNKKYSNIDNVNPKKHQGFGSAEKASRSHHEKDNPSKKMREAIKDGKLGKGHSGKYESAGSVEKEHGSYHGKGYYSKEMREARVLEVEKALDLTDEQKASFEKLRSETDAFMSEKKKEMMEFHKGQHKEFRKFLTEEQKEKMDAVKESHHGKRKLKDGNNYRVVEKAS